jgi:hypothetical protein
MNPPKCLVSRLMVSTREIGEAGAAAPASRARSGYSAAQGDEAGRMTGALGVAMILGHT